MQAKPHVYAYIDETGDRGQSEASSPIFGMAAVLVDETGSPLLRAAVEQLRTDFNVPVRETMSWKRHVKTHDRRRYASDTLSRVTGIKVCYVYTVKDALRRDSYLAEPSRFYNYIAYKAYKSVLWGARSWKGSDAQVWTRYGHVKGHDHRTTEAYLRREAAADYKVPSHMEQGLRWVSADRYLESQAADLYAGFLKAALWPDGPFGYTEPAYLLGIWPQLRNSEDCAIPLGIMSMPNYQLLQNESWFPCLACTK